MTKKLSPSAKMQLIQEMFQSPEHLQDGLLIEVSGGLITKEEALQLLDIEEETEDFND